jgi:hypothetical protein
MNNYYDYENRMMEVKNEVERTARNAWKTAPKKARLSIHLQIVRSFLLWLVNNKC